LIIALLAAVIGVALRQQWLPSLATWLDIAPVPPTYLGYIEGETSLISAPSAGRLVELNVKRGGQVKRGATVFKLDSTEIDAEVAQYQASIADATAQLSDLETGKRQPEQDVVRAQLREQQAALVQAQLDLDRASRLMTTGAGTKQALDQADSQYKQTKARVDQLQAQLTVGDMPGRDQEIAAAKARIAVAKAQLAQAQSRQCDRAPVAPADAEIEDTFFVPGEWVEAGQPVASLLAPGDVKLRFFVLEADVAKAMPGRLVQFHCDGCATGMSARITYVSPRTEFTPQVIYSDTARTKLVFLVEAKPAELNPALRPGLPIQVEAFEASAP
jgi:HlyD family secretion protein